MITLRANQIVSGLALTIFAGGLGLSAYVGTELGLADHPPSHRFGDARRARARRPPRARPDPVRPVRAGLRVLGPHGCSSALYLARTRFGLNVRAVGEAPASADAMGINVTLYRYVHVLVGGAFAGVGGACYSLSITPGWTAGDTLVGGAGWIAIALVIFAFWRAELCLVGAYLFGALSALPFALQARDVDVDARVPLRPAVRDDDRRARARLDRAREAKAGRSGGARGSVRARGDARTALVDVLTPRSLDEALASEGRASGRRADPGRDRRDGRAQLRPQRARRPSSTSTRSRELRGWSRENGTLRLGAGLTYTEAMQRRARGGAARARRGVAHGRLAADPQPRDDRRKPRHGVARRRRAPAAARRGRRRRARERARRAARSRSATSCSA